MENASKALLIAAGILIAILIISLLIKTFSSISSFQNTKINEEEKEKIIAFNEQYTKYLNQYVYGTEVLSLINKYENDKKVQVYIASVQILTGTYDEYCKETRYYKCTEIQYDNSTGKVNQIKFEKVEAEV